MITARKWVAWLCLAVMVIAAAEAASRCFWKVMYGVPFFHSEQILCLYYPEAKDLFRGKVKQDPRALQVLVLGASVMTPTYGNIPRLLHQTISQASGRPIQLFNVARSSLSSRDSLIKYRHLGKYHFDLVIFYHGINDTRANNVSPGEFRADYSHYGCYDAVNALERHPEIRWFSLPFMLDYLRISLASRLGLKHYMPSEWPDDRWIRREGPILTKEAFARNVEEILKIAKTRREKVLLMTFCSYKAPGYSREAFEKGTLGYVPSRHPQAFPIELWGDANYIPRALDASNQALRTLAREHGTLFIDMERIMPKKGSYFVDFCHFSSKGVVMFKELTARYLLTNWDPLKRSASSILPANT